MQNTIVICVLKVKIYLFINFFQNGNTIHFLIDSYDKTINFLINKKGLMRLYWIIFSFKFKQHNVFKL